MARQRIVIVGAGLAGGVAAATLRKQGFDGLITLVGEEKRPPYSRPSLSKEYMRGEDAFEDLLVNPSATYLNLDIELRLQTRAISIQPTSKSVQLESGEHLGYDRLLVTTGGRNRSIDAPGVQLDGVFGLRTVDDADRIRVAVRAGSRAVVVGMGFIGSEVAASLRQLGAEVTAVEHGTAPLGSVLGEQVGKELAAIHRERGVRLVLGDSVTSFEGSQRVEQVRTKGGLTIGCDLAIVGVGIVPNVELLKEAGAQVQNGVMVDHLCRTSLPDVYAAGDIADSQHRVFGRSRVEHWNNAFNQGRSAAQSILGKGKSYEYIHSFWSDQYDHSIEYVGIATGWDQVIFRGSVASRRCLGFYLKEGRLQAVMGLNRGGDPEDHVRGSDLKKCVDLVRGRVRVDPAKLADEDCSLRATVIS